jgi:hypothetical protein
LNCLSNDKHKLYITIYYDNSLLVVDNVFFDNVHPHFSNALSIAAKFPLYHILPSREILFSKVLSSFCAEGTVLYKVGARGQHNTTTLPRILKIDDAAKQSALPPLRKTFGDYLEWRKLAAKGGNWSSRVVRPIYRQARKDAMDEIQKRTQRNRSNESDDAERSQENNDIDEEHQRKRSRINPQNKRKNRQEDQNENGHEDQ